jgi:hypothetical protein
LVAGTTPAYSLLEYAKSQIGAEGLPMEWHVWLFRFLLAWNLILIAALIVMVSP